MGRINIDKFKEAYEAGQFKFIKYRKFSIQYNQHIYQIGDLIKEQYGDSYLYLKQYLTDDFLYFHIDSFNPMRNTYITLEEILDMPEINEDVKQELLFNLDIFNGKA